MEISGANILDTDLTSYHNRLVKEQAEEIITRWQNKLFLQKWDIVCSLTGVA